MISESVGAAIGRPFTVYDPLRPLFIIHYSLNSLIVGTDAYIGPFLDFDETLRSDVGIAPYTVEF